MSRLEGRSLVLRAPAFAAEACGVKLPPRTLRILLRAQADLLAFCDVHDVVLDGASATVVPGELVLPLAAAVRGLAQLFPARHPFWRHFDALARQQIASARWELAGRGRPPPPSDSRLSRALGHKISLWRWPAAAVAHLAGRPREVRRLDALLDRFYRALQLCDDVTDVDVDRETGQINAVHAAMARLRGVPESVTRAAATATVMGAAARELRVVLRDIPAGAFSRACTTLASVCDAESRRQCELAALRLAGAAWTLAGARLATATFE